jgi:hypothetical protein
MHNRYLIRSKGDGFAMSIVLKGRFVHRLIELDPEPDLTGKQEWIVDKMRGDWGSTIPEVCAMPCDAMWCVCVWCVCVCGGGGGG